MTIALLGLLALFCSVTGIALAHWGANWWMVSAFTITAVMSLQMSYLTTSILIWMR